MGLQTLCSVLACIFTTAVLAADPLPRAKPESVGMSSARLARIGKFLREDVDKNRIPGAVVAIARKGKLVYFEAHGFRRRVRGHSKRRTEDTNPRAASRGFVLATFPTLANGLGKALDCRDVVVIRTTDGRKRGTFEPLPACQRLPVGRLARGQTRPGSPGTETDSTSGGRCSGGGNPGTRVRGSVPTRQ